MLELPAPLEKMSRIGVMKDNRSGRVEGCALDQYLQKHETYSSLASVA